MIKLTLTFRYSVRIYCFNSYADAQDWIIKTLSTTKLNFKLKVEVLLG